MRGVGNTSFGSYSSKYNTFVFGTDAYVYVSGIIESLLDGENEVLVLNSSYMFMCLFSQQTALRSVENLKFEDCCYPLNMDSYDALKSLAKKGKVFDIIFIDPPYCKEMIPEAIKIIKEHNLLKEDGIIVTKIDSIEEIYEGYEDIILTKSKKYGNTTVCYYRVDSELE